MSESKPFIVPVFLPNAGCPHHCVFCNQVGVTGFREAVCSSNAFNKSVVRFLNHKGPNRYPVQISFYGGNFLGLEKDEIQRLLTEAEQYVSTGRVNSIRFSTRPDTITTEKLNGLDGYTVSTIELGVQSMNDRVLAMSGRGHTAADVVGAVSLLKEGGYETGLQMMVGLPGDDDNGAMASAEKIAALAPDFVRIYPTLVFRNSGLAGWYQTGRYMPMPLDLCVTLVKKLYKIFRDRKIPVVRMGLQASDEPEFVDSLLAGPYHPAFGHLVYSELFLDRVLSEIASISGLPDRITLRVHPRWESRWRGQNNRNIHHLTETFQLQEIRILTDPTLGQDDLVIAANR